MSSEIQVVPPLNEAPATEYKFIFLMILAIAGIILVLACLAHAIYSFVCPRANVIIDVNSPQDYMLTSWNPLVVLSTWPIRVFYFLKARKTRVKDGKAKLDGDVERGLELADSSYLHVDRNEISRPQEVLHDLFTPQRLHTNVRMSDLPAERMPDSHAEYLRELPFVQVSGPETPTSQWSVFGSTSRSPPPRSAQLDRPLPPLPSRSSSRSSSRCSSPQSLRRAALWKRLGKLPSGRPGAVRQPTWEYLAQFPRDSHSPSRSPTLPPVSTLSPVAPVSPSQAGATFLEDGRNVIGGENAAYFGTEQAAHVLQPHSPALARGGLEEGMVTVRL
jgi:hypothetical protein